jgi:hypothetical protein
MAHEKPQLVSYEKTIYDLLIENIQGKYFQNILSPHLIAQIPKELGIHLIEDGKLSAWFPLSELWMNLSLEEFNQYAQISEEQFNEYKENKQNLSNILLTHKDAPIFKEENKANLSAQKSQGGLWNTLS